MVILPLTEGESDSPSSRNARGGEGTPQVRLGGFECARRYLAQEPNGLGDPLIQQVLNRLGQRNAPFVILGRLIQAISAGPSCMMIF